MSGKSRLFWVVAFVCVLAGATYAALTVERQPVSAPDVGKHTAEVGIASPWTQVVADASTVDNSGNPVTTEAQVEAVHPYPAAKRLDVSGAGSHLVLRMKYENALISTVGPTVSVLGIDINGAIEKLRTMRGDLSAVLTPNAGDTASGIYRYTVPDDMATFPLRGAQQVVVAIEGALSGTGTVSTSTVEARTFSAVGGVGLVDYNARGTEAETLTKATWTALASIGNGSHRYLQIILSDDTSGETAVVHVWGSSDVGTTWFPMTRADTLADAKDVTLAVGTYRPAAAGNYSASVVVAVGPATHIYLTEKTAPTAGTYSYLVGGL